MNIYHAILAAADHIERYPREFQFCAVSIPKKPNCGMPGCALGWIGTFANLPPVDNESDSISRVAWNDIFPPGHPAYIECLLGISQHEFYRHMNSFVHKWMTNAKACARGLRLYAEHYHSAPRSDHELVADLMRRVNELTINSEVKSQELAWACQHLDSTEWRDGPRICTKCGASLPKLLTENGGSYV